MAYQIAIIVMKKKKRETVVVEVVSIMHEVEADTAIKLVQKPSLTESGRPTHRDSSQ